MRNTSANTVHVLVSLWYAGHMIKNDFNQYILIMRIVAMATAKSIDVLCGF